MKKSGFTLIELLIVVAIIGILAAIAIPNFLEAQLRAKIAKVHGDMRTMANAVTLYQVDNGSYMFGWVISGGRKIQINDQGLRRLTSPIQYIASLPTDKFYEWSVHYGRDSAGWGNNLNLTRYYTVWKNGPPSIQKWGFESNWAANTFPHYNREAEGFIVWSYGPDGGTTTLSSGLKIPPCWPGSTLWCSWAYDATNGTWSYGNIHRFGG